jgi:hypothetical protein
VPALLLKIPPLPLQGSISLRRLYPPDRGNWTGTGGTDLDSSGPSACHTIRSEGLSALEITAAATENENRSKKEKHGAVPSSDADAIAGFYNRRIRPVARLRIRAIEFVLVTRECFPPPFLVPFPVPPPPQQPKNTKPGLSNRFLRVARIRIISIMLTIRTPPSGMTCSLICTLRPRVPTSTSRKTRLLAVVAVAAAVAVVGRRMGRFGRMGSGVGGGRGARRRRLR